MTPDPLAFLRATHDAVQAEAEAARHGGDGVWSQSYPDSSPGMVTDSSGEYVVYDDGLTSFEQAAHMARHAPAAVLSRIAGERKQLELHAADSDGECATCGEDEGGAEVNGLMLRVRLGVPHPCDTIRILAECWGWTDTEGA